MSILTKIEIKGLWETTDIEWNLNLDVNILGGHNGSGKSTILNILKAIIFENDEKYLDFFDEILLTTKKNGVFKVDGLKINQKPMFVINSKHFANRNEILRILQHPLLQKNDFLHSFEGISSGQEIDKNKLEDSTKEDLIDLFNSQFISTFEQPLIDINASQKYLFNPSIQTTLDFELTKLLQDKYKNYLLNLSKKVQDLLSNDSIEDVRTAQKELYYFKKRFEDLINQLFSETGKTLIYEELTNQILFQKGDEKLTPYQLSSGEKQILIILLSTLIQDNKPTIMLMDEPETGLHIKWQQKLIGYIRELNPNVQLIMTTHSPGLFMEKWIDNVVEISEISKKS